MSRGIFSIRPKKHTSVSGTVRQKIKNQNAKKQKSQPPAQPEARISPGRAFDRQASKEAQIDFARIPCPAAPNGRFAVRTNAFLFSIFSKGCGLLLPSFHACMMEAKAFYGASPPAELAVAEINKKSREDCTSRDFSFDHNRFVCQQQLETIIPRYRNAQFPVPNISDQRYK